MANSDNKEIVQVGSKIYLFPRLPFETDQQYFGRKTFLTKAAPKTQKKYLDAVKYSMVWANIQFLGCSYSPSVIKDLNKLTDSFN